MDKSALERYFDHFMDSLRTKEEEEELTEEEELCISLLPDELLTLNGSGQDNTDETRQTAESQSRAGLHCSALDYSSQNSTGAAHVLGASSLLELGGSSTRLVTPVLPVIHVMTLPEINPQIQNVISTAKLGCHLDLDLIAHRAWNIEYNPKTFKALIMRIREPRAVALIYKSGNMVCTGAKSEDQSRVAIRRFARIVQKLGFPVSILKFKVQNLVASCSTFPVSLERLSLAHFRRCSYEPELFPGLFYNVMPGVTVTIFASGKMTMSGATKAADTLNVFNTVYPILSGFRRQ